MSLDLPNFLTVAVITIQAFTTSAMCDEAQRSMNRKADINVGGEMFVEADCSTTVAKS